ncbi:MAG: rhomboid family intramembrane serine protease [Bacteroidetes bacterium GWF2_33_38]|nr:MAG: rhomboid family intramembrane serine protease [Bacteroidetes bacterium GWF2_33_38]OFY92180.1 MAG: rhomboid family intramembrane serine protease [Bacteroidetes bacterium RIFOXYA2_FULL_33_7]
MLPPVVKNLLIINILFFFATYAVSSAFNMDLSEMLGLYYFESEKFKIYQYLTYMFMHAGFSHIFFNMFALWMFGKILENVWGPKRFLIYYFVTGLGAAAIHTLVSWWSISGMMTDLEIFRNTPSPELFAAFIDSHLSNPNPQLFDFINEWSLAPQDSAFISQATDLAQRITDVRLNVPTVGASGAVFGVLLAFGMLFPNSVLYIYFAIPIKAKYFVMIYGAIELFMGISNNPSDNVAHFAHLGGMLFGFFLIRYWKNNQFREG